MAASLLLVPAGAFVLGGIGIAIRSDAILGVTTIVVGSSLATGGAVAAPWDPLDFDRLGSVILLGLTVLHLPLAAIIVIVLSTTGIMSDLSVIFNTATGLLFLPGQRSIPTSVDVILTFLLVTVVTTVLIQMLFTLPLFELAPGERRDEVEAMLVATVRFLERVRVVAIIAPIGVIILKTFLLSAAVGIPDILARSAIGLVTWGPLRLLLVSLTALGIGVTMLAWLLPRVARLQTETIITWSLPSVAGIVLIGVAVVFGAEIVTWAQSGPLAPFRFQLELFLTELPPAALVLAAGVGSGAVAVGLYIAMSVLGYVLFPKRAASVALAATGLFIGAVGSLITDIGPLVSFVLVAGSLFVWDVGAHAATLGAEIGRHAPTRHVELVRTGGSALIAAVGVLLATGSLVVTVRLSGPRARVAPLVLIASLFGTMVLISGLRSR
jgi:hypothetical protein